MLISEGPSCIWKLSCVSVRIVCGTVRVPSGWSHYLLSTGITTYYTDIWNTQTKQIYNYQWNYVYKTEIYLWLKHVSFLSQTDAQWLYYKLTYCNLLKNILYFKVISLLGINRSLANYYDLLGVKPDASLDQIKNAFFDKSKKVNFFYLKMFIHINISLVICCGI